MNTIRRGTPLPPADRSRLAEAIHRHGLRVVLAAIGGHLRRPTLGAALGGLPIMAGTAALIRQGLEAIDLADRREAEAAALAAESGALLRGGRL